MLNDYDLINRIYNYLNENYNDAGLTIKYEKDKKLKCKSELSKRILFKIKYSEGNIYFHKITKNDETAFFHLSNKTEEELLQLIDYLIKDDKERDKEFKKNKVTYGINYPISINTNCEEYFNNLKEYKIEDYNYQELHSSKFNKTLLTANGSEYRLIESISNLESVKDIKTQCLLEENNDEVLVAPVVVLQEDNSIIILMAVKEERDLFNGITLGKYKKISKYCEEHGFCYGMRDNEGTYIKELLLLSDEEEDMYEEAENEIMDKLKNTHHIDKKQVKAYIRQYTLKVFYNVIFNNIEHLITYKNLDTIKYKK